MIRAFLLLITLNLVCISSYLMYNCIDAEIDSSEESIKREMLEANQEMEKNLGKKIFYGKEPDELIKFREAWMQRLQDVKSLKREKKSIENNLISIIVPLLLSFKFAVIQFIYVDEIAVLNGFKIYSTHIGWVFLTIALIPIVQAFKDRYSCITLMGPEMLNCFRSLPVTMFKALESLKKRRKAHPIDNVYKRIRTHLSLLKSAVMTDDSYNHT